MTECLRCIMLSISFGLSAYSSSFGTCAYWLRAPDFPALPLQDVISPTVQLWSRACSIALCRSFSGHPVILDRAVQLEHFVRPWDRCHAVCTQPDVASTLANTRSSQRQRDQDSNDVIGMRVHSSRISGPALTQRCAWIACHHKHRRRRYANVVVGGLRSFRPRGCRQQADWAGRERLVHGADLVGMFGIARGLGWLLMLKTMTTMVWSRWAVL